MISVLARAIDYSKPGGYSNELQVPPDAQSDCLDALSELPTYKGKLLKTSKDGSTFIAYGVNSPLIMIYGKNGGVSVNGLTPIKCLLLGKQFNSSQSLNFIVKSVFETEKNKATIESIIKRCNVNPILAHGIANSQQGSQKPRANSTSSGVIK